MEEERHLTIKEIKDCEKATNICHKTAIISAIVSGCSFLVSFVNIGFWESKEASIWNKLLEYLLLLCFVLLGYSTSEISRNAFKECEKMEELIKNEKEYLENEGKTI